MKTICFIASRSGGHITPCLTLARQYKQKNPATHIMFLTGTSALEQELTSDPVIDQRYTIALNKLPHKKIAQYPTFIFQLLWAFLKSFYFLAKHRPEQVISTGGHSAIPVCSVARFLRIPVHLWELNVVPGRTIRWLAKHAQQINICYPQTKDFLAPYMCVLQAYPIRYTNADKVPREQALEALKFNQERKTILILGGSQGSQELNNLIKTVIDQKSELAQKIQVIHQTGPHNPEFWRNWYQQRHIPAKVFAYKHNTAPFFNAADLVISRAGAGALAEIIFFEKQAIIIPHEHTEPGNHQKYNAAAAVQQFPDKICACTLEKAARVIVRKLGN